MSKITGFVVSWLTQKPSTTKYFQVDSEYAMLGADHSVHPPPQPLLDGCPLLDVCTMYCCLCL